MNELVDEILRGSYDLHLHAGPDPSQERRLDALETARHAYEAEMAGFVLKSHEYPTASLAYALNRIYPGLAVAGSIALNKAVGGVNPEAVQVSVKMGAKCVWMPTIDADHFTTSQGCGPGLRLLSDAGDLLPEVHEILEIIKRHELVVASGHVSLLETHALFKAAMDKGIRRMVVTHPKGVFSIAEQQELVSVGAFVEYTFLSCMPSHGGLSFMEMVENLRKLGVENCVVTTDLGQWMNPPPAEGMRMAIAALLQAGMSRDEVTALVKVNPSRLLDTD